MLPSDTGEGKALKDKQDCFLFVYGTLRYQAKGKMSALLSGSANFLGEAHFQGKLYRIDYYPGVVDSTSPEDQVVGDVFRLRTPDVTLPALDDYERVGPPYEEPYEYERCLLPVTLTDGQTIPCWIYLYRHSVEGMELIAGGDFLASQRNQ